MEHQERTFDHTCGSRSRRPWLSWCRWKEWDWFDSEESHLSQTKNDWNLPFEIVQIWWKVGSFGDRKWRVSQSRYCYLCKIWDGCVFSTSIFALDSNLLGHRRVYISGCIPHFRWLFQTVWVPEWMPKKHKKICQKSFCKPVFTPKECPLAFATQFRDKHP